MEARAAALGPPRVTSVSKGVGLAPIWVRQGEPGHPGLSFARSERSSQAAAAFGTGSACVLSPNTSPCWGTPLASEFPEALWVAP